MNTIAELLIDLPFVPAVLLKATVLLALAWLIHFALHGRNPRWRVLLWRSVVIGLAVLPLAEWVLPALEIAVEEQTAAAPAQPVPNVDWPTTQPVQTSQPIFKPSATPQPLQSEPIQPGASIGQWFAEHGFRLLLAIWAFVLFVLLVRTVRGWSRLQHMLREATPAPKRIVDCAHDTAQNLGIRRRFQLWLLRGLGSPFLTGIVRPTIVLPSRSVDEAGSLRTRAVLAHELAHAKSNDALWMPFIRLVTMLLWFHPLMWRVRQAHSAACEEVCDGVAAEYVGGAQPYSKALANEALALLDGQPAPGGVAMIRSAEIVHRIRKIQRGIRANPLARRWVTATLAVGAALLIALGSLRLVTAQQDRPDPEDYPHAIEVETYQPEWAAFQEGDSIEILEVRGTAPELKKGERYYIRGRYTLASRDSALLHVYATNGEVQSEQGTAVTKGEGEFTRTFELIKEGMPHVSYYGADDEEGFGGIYIRTLIAEPGNLDELVVGDWLGRGFLYWVRLKLSADGTYVQETGIEGNVDHTNRIEGTWSIEGDRLTRTTGELKYTVKVLDFDHDSFQLEFHDGRTSTYHRADADFASAGGVNERLRQPFPDGIVRASSHIGEVMDAIAEYVDVNIIVDNRVVRPMDASQLDPEADYVTDGILPVVRLEDITLQEGLKAILEPLGLGFNVVRGQFIWISTPEKLEHETFEDLETRFYEIRSRTVLNANADIATDRGKQIDIVALLRQTVPNVFEPGTGQALSFIHFNEDTNNLVAHTTPTRHRQIEQLLALAGAQESDAASADSSATGIITGVLKVGGEPMPYTRVILTPQFEGSVSSKYVETDADGRFDFADLLPGWYHVGLFKKFEQRTKKWNSPGYTSSHTRNVFLEPGETVDLVIGGKGRRIVGQLVAPDDAPIEVGWQSESMRRMYTDESWRERAPEGLTQEQRSAWWETYRTTPEYVATHEKSTMFVIDINADGSFSVDDVPPGSYRLRIDIGDANREYRGVAAGTTNQLITVPDGAYGSVYDVGDVPVEIYTRLDPGDQAPDFTAATLDGGTVSLAEHRGKHVLLHFWYPTFELDPPQRVFLQEVYETYGERDDFVMIGLSNDATIDGPREFVQKHGIEWTQAYLGGWNKTDISDNFGVRVFPSIMLIGPDGTVIARDLRSDRILEAVAAALGSQETHGGSDRIGDRFDSDSWRARFDKVYRLEEDEALKRVMSPFIPERDDFFDSMYASRGGAIEQSPDYFVFYWSNGIEKQAKLGFGDLPTIEGVVTRFLGISTEQIDAPEDILTTEVSGDWIVRRSAAPQERLDALAEIITKDLGLEVDFNYDPGTLIVAQIQDEKDTRDHDADADSVAASSSRTQAPDEFAKVILQRQNPDSRDRALAELKRMLTEKPRPSDTIWALTALQRSLPAKFEREPLRELVLPLLESNSPQIRELALRCLPGLECTVDALDAIIPLADDPKPSVRAEAGRALILIGQGDAPEKIIPALTQLLQDEESKVIVSTLRSMWGQYSSPDFDRLLIELSRDEEYRGYTIYHALSTMKPKSVAVVRRLIDELDEPDWNDKGRAAWGLTYGVPEAAYGELEEALLRAIPEELNAYTREQEYRALQNVATERSRDFLQSVVDSDMETDADKARAQAILDKLGPVPAEDQRQRQARSQDDEEQNGARRWRARFEEVYRLEDDEVLKRIVPPFIPERTDYYHTDHSMQAEHIERPPDSFTFHWNGELKDWGYRFGTPIELENIITHALQISRGRFEGAEDVLNTHVSGDWIVRTSAEPQALLDALTNILRDDLQLDVRFEPRREPRTVVVVSGSSESEVLRALVGRNAIRIEAGELGSDHKVDRGGAHGNIATFLDHLGNYLEVRFLNEATVSEDEIFEWTNFISAQLLEFNYTEEEKLMKIKEILQNLHEQTGLDFTIEDREVDLWVAVRNDRSP